MAAVAIRGGNPTLGPPTASASAHTAANGSSVITAGADAFLPHRLRHTLASTVDSNVHVKLDVPSAGALGVDATGSIAVLAGRRGLHLVDLEAPYTLAATLHHQTKWDVTVAQFNPHIAFKSYVASTSNSNTLVWNVARCLQTPPHGNGYAPLSLSQSPPLVATLRSHTRPVSDLGWAPTEPTLLATCSADGKTHLWDTRTPQRPVQTLHTFSASAVQLAWHRVDATTLATAHEGEVRIWDTRASDKTPAVLMTAHMQKIYGLDWHPKRMDELLTCSEDKTVKFWNVSHPRVCQGSLTTGAPVWRAKYTPFGDGIATSSHRQDTALRLWSLAYAAGGDVANGNTITLDQVHAFAGHTDLVRSFEWRERTSSNQNQQYQLVSWSKNQELRLWRLDPHQLRACGHIQTERQTSGASGTTAGSPQNGASDLSFDPESDGFELTHSMHPSRRAVPRTKYDATTLKNDFAPLAVPSAAVPLGASEYSLVQGGHEENNAVLRALLTFDDDLSKLGDGNASGDDDDDDDDESPTTRESLSLVGKAIVSNSADTEPVSLAAVLPCPRIFGACFSGPNVLVMFDSRVALGQTRHMAATPPVAPVAPGKSAKPMPTPTVLKKMPRTYEQLLEMRDSRFSKKKNKKSPARLLSGAAGGIGVGGGAMELSTEWSGVTPLEFMDANHFGQDDPAAGDRGGLGKLRGPSRGSGFFNTAGILAGTDSGGDNEFAVHGASEYLKTYFSNQELHQPVKHSDHRTSMPLTPLMQGLSLSPPRAAAVMAASSDLYRGFGPPLNVSDARAAGKRNADQPAIPSLQLDLSLSVSLLDLSRLCGVSSVLTYGTQLASFPAARDESVDDSSSAAAKLDAGTHDLYAWMLKATESRRIGGRIHSKRARRGASFSSPALTSQKTHPLSRILQSLIADGSHSHQPHSSQNARTSVSDVCAYNAQIASLAGRSDLQQVWALLELTTASDVRLPQQQQALPLQHQELQPLQPKALASSSGVYALVTSHPWRAHPFGQNLVNKVLSMYEDSGDLPTLAAIVCALQPPSLPDTDADTTDTMTLEMDQLSASQLQTVSEYNTPSLSSATTTAPATPSALSTTSIPAKATTSPFTRSRTSFNSLTQLLGGQSDIGEANVPPVMRSARRSSSHNEVPKLSLAAAERGESPRLTPHKASAKDWPMTARGNQGLNARHQVSPAIGPVAAPGGWKGIDFEKMENPFKTWSGGSAAARADASPRTLTSDTFRPPGTPLTLAATTPRRHRGSSAVDSDDEVSLTGRIHLHVDKRYGDAEHSILSTDPQDERRYDGYKEAYAEVLYQYGALNLRGDVLKSAATETASSTSGGEDDEDQNEDGGLRFGVLCRSCQSVSSGLYCSACRDFSIKCSICQLVVRGQSMYCMTCGHGGHEQHMREWFEEENACPTGCGCWCKQATAIAMPSGDGRGTGMEEMPAAGEGRLQSRSYSF